MMATATLRFLWRSCRVQRDEDGGAAGNSTSCLSLVYVGYTDMDRDF